jgi:hypothetical protein
VSGSAPRGLIKQKPRHVGRRADRGFQARRRVEHTGPNLALLIRS